MKKMEAIIFSMTKKERSNPEIINPPRKKRIAAGALIKEIIEVELRFFNFLFQLTGLRLVIVRLNFVDQRQHISHAENPRSHAIGIKLLQIG